MFDLHFKYPELFFLIIPVIIILIFLYRQKKYGYKIGFMNDLLKIYKGGNIIYIKIIIIFFILSLFITILSRPYSVEVTEKINKEGVDIVLLFDTSYSMIAEDMKPNRLDVAKNVILNFINKLKTDRLGLVVFSGKPFTSLPLTFDYGILKQTVSKISIDTINQNYYHLQGTAIGDAILMGSKLFDSSILDREKIIILLTDGEANRGIAPLEALKFSVNQNIKIYTIGVGGIKDTFVDINSEGGMKQRIQIGGIDEKTLKTIAKSSNGKYFRATDEDSFNDIFDEISKIEKSDIEVDIINKNKNEYKIFLYILLILIFVYILKFKE